MTLKDIIVQKVMHGDETQLSKTLWRMSGGNRDKAFKIIRECATHFTSTPVDDLTIDRALAELNGGVEVEWDS
jgi:hypothetical protein